jgi:hypothetical protein
MSTKLILYSTASDHCVYSWSRGRLELEASFGADDAGLEGFREYLRGRQGALFSLLADLSGEDFHEDQIPFLRGNDRETVIQRRLVQRYRDSRLAAGLSLGYVTGERRNERLLLASFSNPQQFVPWLDALSESGARLAGVYSVPLLAPALAARLGARAGPCLVVTLNRAGLRQCFVDNRRLRFARLERALDMPPAALAAFVRSETARLAQYLSTTRALPREGPPIQVIAVAPPGLLPAFEQVLVSDPRLEFHAVGIEEAAKAIGVKHAPAGASAEQLYLHLAVRRPPKEQFARREERRSFMFWRLQRAVVVAGAIAFAGCTVEAGIKWLDILNTRAQTTSQEGAAREAEQRYESITATFPVTQTTTENLKATVVEFTKIADRSASPEPAMIHLSKVMDEFPQIELDSLTWSVEQRADKATLAQTSAAASTPAAASGEFDQVLRIDGQVNATQRSDYRAITAQVQDFARALVADKAYRIVRTRLPFDITSEGTLTGDIGEAESREAPRFTIILSRKLP